MTPKAYIYMNEPQEPSRPHMGFPPNFPPFPPPMAIAMRLSDAECAHIDELRLRSYRLAIERGHIRR